MDYVRCSTVTGIAETRAEAQEFSAVLALQSNSISTRNHVALHSWLSGMQISQVLRFLTDERQDL